MFEPYSVLMAVYDKENPQYLRLAIESMLNQSVMTDDFVIVRDGTLTENLDEVINSYVKKYNGIFQIISLEKNRGLGNALNVGIQYCKNNIVARMDSDDISLHNRCELQLLEFDRNQELALCSGNIAEFEDNTEDIKSIRYVPTAYSDILKYAKKRNPMNHMAVMYRKEAVINAGNYIEMSLAEDYYLWVRMLQKGYQAINVNEILVFARIGNGMYARRGGFSYARKIYILEKNFLELHFITRSQFGVNCFIRICSSLFPQFIRKFLYQKKLRNIIN